MVRRILVWTGVCALALASGARAAPFNDVANGTWSGAGTWDVGAGFPGSGDTATIDSNRVWVNILVDPNTQVIVQAGGRFQPIIDNINVDLTMDGGANYIRGLVSSWTGKLIVFDGDLNVTGAGMEFLSYGGDKYNYIQQLNGVITSPTAAIVCHGGNTRVRLSNGANVINGWDIDSGQFEVAAVGALGAGTVNVNGNDTDSRLEYGMGTLDGVLVFSVDDSSAPPVFINANGEVRNKLDSGVSKLNVDITLNGGTLTSDTSADSDFGGVITLAADSNFHAGSIENLALGGPTSTGGVFASGTITGPGNVTKTGGKTLYLGAAAAGWTGDLTVAGGTVVTTVANAVNGAVLVNSRLVTGADDSLASASSVVVSGGGVLELGSTESNATLQINAGGGLLVSGGSTALDYDTKVQVQVGAILDPSLSSLPTLVQLKPGDGGYGVYKAAVSGVHSVGPYSPGAVYRGLANVVGAAIFSGSVTEAAGGPPPTAGISMLSGTGATFAYDRATFVTQGTNTIKLTGPGDHVIQGIANSFNNDLEKLGAGMLTIATATAISGVTVTVNEGALGIGHVAALTGGTVNLNCGGLVLNMDLTGGTINVGNGVGIAIDAASRLESGATINFQNGAHLLLRTSGISSTEIPTDGSANIIMEDSVSGPGGTGGFRVPLGVVLNDDTYLMTPADADGRYFGLHQDDPALTTTGSAGRIGINAGPNGDNRMCLAGRIAFAGKTLIVGSTTPVWTMNTGGASWGYNDMAGTVNLRNSGNEIGRLDVRSGSVTTKWGSLSALGNPQEIIVHSGAVIQHFSNSQGTTMSALFRGSGTFGIWYSADKPRELIIPASDTHDTGISPGIDGAGILEMYCVPKFRSYGSGSGTIYPKVTLEVVGSGNTAGVDHDQVYLPLKPGGTAYWEGDVDFRQADGIIQIAVPSKDMKPNELGDMVVVKDDLDVDLLGPFNTEALQTRGFPADTHWQLKTSTDLLTYTNTGIVLHGGDLEWTARQGDSNLDDSVDVFDLADLANNYGVTSDVDWTKADWDLSGNVDVYDLALLANNYGWTVGGGGDVVPEPATLGLIALGALAVLRRRRR